MSIYSNKQYRKIYEYHYGPIGKDSNGRSLEVHHIDGDHNNNHIDNLKLVTIQEHFDIHYAQGDYGACFFMARRMSLSPEEISNLSSKTQRANVAKGTHPFSNGKLAKARVANGTHCFSPGGVLAKRVAAGTHHLQGADHILKRIANGTHPAQTKVSCLCCRRIIGFPNFVLWHGDKCRSKK